MIVGILKEIKPEEYRVSMTPAGVDQMVSSGHTVLVERSAGLGSSYTNDHYVQAGATIVDTPEEIFTQSDMVMHVKEIMPEEYGLIKPDQIVFTYLHLAADRQQTLALMKSKCIAIAYETVQTDDGRLPLLQPMSEIAGRMAAQQGAKYLEKTYGGCGVLMGGIPGVAPANVIVIGGGSVGTNAAKIACGMGADVTIFDTSLERLRYLSEVMPANCKLLMSSPKALRDAVKTADLLIGAVLIPGAKAPVVVTRAMIHTMRLGAVVVDVAIDQGGCFETSHATTHCNPTYTVESVIHYCVSNMPGAVPRTSTRGLTNATLPYALAIANKGWEKAAADDPALAKGINVCRGKVVYEPVKAALEL